MRIYPETLKKWKDSFSLYQKTAKKNKNSENVSRAASDVILNYVSSTEINLDLKFVMDGKIANEMLVLFTSRKDLTCDTKLKYLKYYQSFITFLCRNALSPEITGDEEYETILYREAKIKEIECIIDDYRAGLVSQNKTEKPFKMQRKKQTFR